MAEPQELEAETAARWIAQLTESLGVEPLSAAAQALVLHLARDVAHGAERKCAPLATFVTGRFVEAEVAKGADVGDALATVRRVVEGLLPESPATS